MMENFIVYKYNAGYIIQNNAHVNHTYMTLHRILLNELYSLKELKNYD